MATKFRRKLNVELFFRGAECWDNLELNVPVECIAKKSSGKRMLILCYVCYYQRNIVYIVVSGVDGFCD